MQNARRPTQASTAPTELSAPTRADAESDLRGLARSTPRYWLGSAALAAGIGVDAEPGSRPCVRRIGDVDFGDADGHERGVPTVSARPRALNAGNGYRTPRILQLRHLFGSRSFGAVERQAGAPAVIDPM